MNFLKIFFFFSLVSLLFSLAVFSEAETKTRIYKLSSDIEWVQVQAQAAQLRIIPVKVRKTNTAPKKTSDKSSDTKQKTIQVEYKGNFKVSSKDKVFKISEKDFPPDNKDIRKSKISDKERGRVTVWLPDQISLRVLTVSGRVEINNINSPRLSVSMLSTGSIQLKNTGGDLSVFQESGEVHLSSHKGSLKVHAENSKVNIENCQGDMEVRSFKGRLSVQKSRGKLNVNTFKTPVILKGFSGQLISRQEKGGLYLKPMTGSIQAYSEEAEIRGKLYPDKVSIETKKGAIFLDMPGSRAWLSMESWDGRIKAPPYFYRVRTGGLNRARGRLRGKGKNKGEVALKSHSGSIRVYQSSK